MSMQRSKFRRYSFWVGVISAVVLIVEATANALGVAMSTDAIVSVGNAILGLLVLLGIIVKDNSQDVDNTKDNDNE